MLRNDDDMTFHDNFIYVSNLEKLLLLMAMQPKVTV